jgi:hypothetical protein
VAILIRRWSPRLDKASVGLRSQMPISRVSWPSNVLHLALAGTVLVSAAPACGLFSSSNSGSVRAESQVTVAVESHNWSDITVYLVGKGLPQRLGTVTALSSATFAFSSQQLGSSGVRLRALPVAGRAFTSETIPVQPGQSIFWTLEDNLETSNFTVY